MPERLSFPFLARILGLLLVSVGIAATCASAARSAAYPGDMTLSFDAEPAYSEFDSIHPGFYCGANGKPSGLKNTAADVFPRDDSPGNVRDGKYSARVTIHGGDLSSYSCAKDSVDAIKWINEGEGSESWWGWSWKLPVGWPGSSSFGMLYEFSVDAGRFPSYGMVNFDASETDALYLVLNTGLTPNPGSGTYDAQYKRWTEILGPSAPRPMVYGKWLDFYMHVVWKSRTSGVMQIWYRVDGDKDFSLLYSDVPGDNALIQVAPHPTLLYNTMYGAPGENGMPGLDIEGGFYRNTQPQTNYYWWDGMRRRSSQQAILAGFPDPPSDGGSTPPPTPPATTTPTTPPPPADTTPTTPTTPAPPPGITSSISSGSTLSGTTHWTITAPPDATAVEFWANNHKLYTDTSAPFEYDLDTTQLPNGTNALGNTWIDPAGVRRSPDANLSVNVQNATPPPVNTSPPTVAGPVQVGVAAHATSGTWSGAPTGYAYQWSSCDAGSDACTPIAGATSSSYVPTVSDAFRTLEVSVTATNAAGSATASSTASTLVAPLPVAPPTISSSISSGSMLTGTEHWTITAPTGTASVEFWANKTRLYTDTSAPFTYDLDTTKLPNGANQLGNSWNDTQGVHHIPDAAIDVTVSNATPDSDISFRPGASPPGATVTVSAPHIDEATSITIGGAPADPSRVVSPNAVQVTVPNDASTGPIQVDTPGPGAVQTTRNFLVRPRVDALSVQSVAPGETFTISGAGLADTSSVLVGGALATYTADPSGTLLTVTVPATADTGRVVVKTPGGTARSRTNLRVLPLLSALDTASGVTGSSVTITGAALGSTRSVRFGGVPAPFKRLSRTQLGATVPFNAVSGAVTVTTPGGSVASATRFAVLPSITRFWPRGKVGRKVVISGSGFENVSAVTFNGAGATFTVRSPNVLVATIPAGATDGPIGVTTQNGVATSTQSFDVRP